MRWTSVVLVIAGLAVSAFASEQEAKLRDFSSLVAASLTKDQNKAFCHALAASTYSSGSSEESNPVDVPEVVRLCMRHADDVHHHADVLDGALSTQTRLAEGNVTGSMIVALELSRSRAVKTVDSVRAFVDRHRGEEDAPSGLTGRRRGKKPNLRRTRASPSPTLLELEQRVGASRLKTAVQRIQAEGIGGILSWMTSSSGASSIGMILADKKGHMAGILSDPECRDKVVGMFRGPKTKSNSEMVREGNAELDDLSRGTTDESMHNALTSIANFIGTLMGAEETTIPRAGLLSPKLADLRAYNEQEAKFAAYWSSIAYQGAGLNMKDFYRPELCAHAVFGDAVKEIDIKRTFISRDWYGNDNYAVLAWASMPPTFTEKVLVVAFSGTRTGAQLVDEIKFGAFQEKFTGFANPEEDAGGSPKISGYFLDAWSRLQEEIVPAVNDELCAHPNAQLFITGHSLGGALATVAAVGLETILHVSTKTGKKTIVFPLASPRVGNWHFAMSYMRLPLHTYRVTHNRDPIPILPSCPLYLEANNGRPMYACDQERARTEPGHFWHVPGGIHYPRHTMPDFMPPPYNTSDPAKASGEPMLCQDEPDGESPKCVNSQLPQDWASVPDSKRCSVLLNFIDEGANDHVIHFGYGISCACNFFLPPPFGLRGFPTEYNPCRAKYVPKIKMTHRGDEKVAMAVEELVGRFEGLEFAGKRLKDMSDLAKKYENMSGPELQAALFNAGGSRDSASATGIADMEAEKEEMEALASEMVKGEALEEDSGELDGEAARLADLAASAATQEEARKVVAAAERLAESPEAAEAMIASLEEKLEAGGEGAASKLHTAVTESVTPNDDAITTMGASTIQIARNAINKQKAGEGNVDALRNALEEEIEGNAAPVPSDLDTSTTLTEADRTFLPADMPMGRPGLPGQGTPVV